MADLWSRHSHCDGRGGGRDQLCCVVWLMLLGQTGLCKVRLVAMMDFVFESSFDDVVLLFGLRLEIVVLILLWRWRGRVVCEFSRWWWLLVMGGRSFADERITR